MSTKAGALLWNRMQITLAANDLLDVDTGITQVNRAFENSSVGEPSFGIIDTVPPAAGTPPASRVHVIPLAPRDAWDGVLHGEPFFNPTTQTVHVQFINPGLTPVTVNALIWDMHTLIGPGQADVYNQAGPPPSPILFLGAAAPFAKLAGSTITNTGNTIDTGDVGISPGSALVGFPPGIINGAQHIADATAAAAQVALTAAYVALAAMVPTAVLTGQDLGGQTLGPGVYFFASSAPITGVLTLDAGGDPDAIFVFQMGSTLLVANGSSVVLTGGAKAGNVYWQVGSSATIGTTALMVGNILAQASITLNNLAELEGRALARVGAVTQDTNIVDITNAS